MPFAKHSDQLAWQRKYQPAFRARNPSYCSEWARRNGFKNQKAWKARNRLKVVECCARRYARTHAVGSEKIDYAEVIAAAKGVCQICFDPLGDVRPDVDHIVPLARGGAHVRSNVRAVHPSCNRKKSARLDDEIPFGILGRR